MKAVDFYKYVKNPAVLQQSSVEELQQLVKDFPYFQSAHLLLSLASKKWDASVYQQSLKMTAIVATNRAHLFNLIHQSENTEPVQEVAEAKHIIEEPATTKENANQELDILKAAEISVEPQVEIPAEVKEEPATILEKEIQKQVVSSFVEKEILKTPEVHRPPVLTDTPESFGDWLTFLKSNKTQPLKKAAEKTEKNTSAIPEQPKVEDEKLQSRKIKNKAIIDRIIDKNPGLIRTKEEQKFYTPDVKAKESLLENEHLVTETLARIYALQGSVNKAVRAYEILSLKYPQKSAYFASLIQKLKEHK